MYVPNCDTCLFHPFYSCRNKDLDRKRDAEKKYGDRHRDTTQWLTGMERKVNQLPVSGKDLAAVQKQLQESKVCNSNSSKYVNLLLFATCSVHCVLLSQFIHSIFAGAVYALKAFTLGFWNWVV